MAFRYQALDAFAVNPVGEEDVAAVIDSACAILFACLPEDATHVRGKLAGLTDRPGCETEGVLRRRMRERAHAKEEEVSFYVRNNAVRVPGYAILIRMSRMTDRTACEPRLNQ
ncbi:hypothetical protein [Paraburkholderia dinghuensis]|uniref:Uncharacterized protein n=1 Tax=Paraburkholderia dinghuensis TaxID=2305225 RepID=A0A3N6MVK6_9BURK|nr:hypothetical protein [Paraburkholderia dinghuensis]RQH08014.1 hypothetical protein D1Y85_07905 [Paraburkholderia dinghuensis]